jgi:homoserine dehydrogenase
MRTMKLAMLGYGNAGKAFKNLLEEKAQALAEAYDTNFEFVSIVTKSQGDLLGSPTDTALEVAVNVDYDILIELTPLNIITGQPAISHIEAALNRGKDVITANKGPIAHDFKRLFKLAKQNGCSFFYETTVMDGTPVFNLVHDTLKFCTVTEVSGILNSTTNFILEEMEKGLPMDQIMEKGRAVGFVEADPLMDIEGYDSAGKITALLNVLMDAGMTPDQIDRKGIEDITHKDIEDAAAKGCKIKLVCKGWREKGKVYGKVAPEYVPLNHLYATINGTSSILSITTDLMGKLTIIEEEPEILQTAYGVFSDLIRIVEKDERIRCGE